MMRQIGRAILSGLFVCVVIAPHFSKVEAQTPRSPNGDLSEIAATLRYGKLSAEEHRCEELKYYIARLEDGYTEERVRELYRVDLIPLSRQDRLEIIRQARGAATELRSLLQKLECAKPLPFKDELARYEYLLSEAYFRTRTAQMLNDCVGFVKALGTFEQLIIKIPPDIDEWYRRGSGQTLSDKAYPVFSNLAAEGCPKKEIQEATPQQKKGAPREARQKGVPRVTTPGLVINTGLDGAQWCTYGSGIGFPTFAPPTDDSGTPLFPGGTFINEPPSWPLPSTVSTPWGGDIVIIDLPSGPGIIETPFGPPRIVKPPPGSVPPSSPPETPTAGPPSQPPTAGPPSTPPVDTPPVRTVFPPEGSPPETPIIIFVKATQSVLEGQPEVALPGYNTAVFPPFKPDLPFTDGSTQTAQQDIGFDKDPVKCTTGQGGECKLELDVGTQQEFGIRPTGGTALKGKPTWGNNFRLDLSVPQTSGGVLEFTGLPTDDVAKVDNPILTQKISELRSGLPDQVNILPEPFRIGDRAFLRLGFDQPFGVTFDPAAHFAKLSSIGGRPVIYIIDFCRDKQPGPPLGAPSASYSSMNQALPAATVRLRHSILDRLRAQPPR